VRKRRTTPWAWSPNQPEQSLFFNDPGGNDMRNLYRPGAATFLLSASLCVLPSMSATAAGEAAAASVKQIKAAMVEKIDGSDLKRVVLTQKAAERLDIKTGKMVADAAGVMTTPYAALIYDGKGKTWVYTNPQPLVYLRAPVVVDSIKGPNVVLKEGPPAGTTVVVLGVAELYGAESGIGK
jgi:hypothetical protein